MHRLVVLHYKSPETKDPGFSFGRVVALSDGLNSGTDGGAGGPEVRLIIYRAHWQTEAGRQFRTVAGGRVWKVWRIGARVGQKRGSGRVVRTWGDWGN